MGKKATKMKKEGTVIGGAIQGCDLFREGEAGVQPVKNVEKKKKRGDEGGGEGKREKDSKLQP